MDAIEEVAPIKNNAKEIFVNATADNGDNAVSDVVKASESGSGSITYGELDSLGRTTGIEATITPDMIGTRSSNKSSIKPAGFGGQVQGHARGHLLGNQLGGE